MNIFEIIKLNDLIYIKMLKNVKASYFLRILFSIINEKQKLELIKHNKIQQEIINVTLINYKYFSGKYIIYE